MTAFEPPVDENGQILPHDHPDLEGERRMLRGIAQQHIVYDANYNCQRLSSALFRNSPKRQGYLSFNSQRCIEAKGDDSVEYMAGRGWVGVVSMSVAHFRTFDPADQPADRWKIGMVPLPDEQPPDPCHGAVWGTISEGRANQIRRAVDWLVEVPGVVLDETSLPHT